MKRCYTPFHCNFFYISLFLFFCVSAIAYADSIGKIEFPLSTGTAVPVGELEAIGTIPGCTATLITQDIVLTAAHCVCESDKSHQCSSRTTFTLHDVLPINDSSSQRRNISVQGDVNVHPAYDGRKSVVCADANVDIAVIRLDTPINRLANITPIPVEKEHFNIPAKSERLTLVGFGDTGKGCKDESKGKMRLTLPIASVDSNAIYFDKKDKHSCPGDSGGPILNAKSHVVGVASCSNRDSSSHYEPVYPFYEWVHGEGGMFIRNSVSEKCIDVKGIPGKNNGDILQLWDCELSGKDPYNNAPTDQKWIFTKDGFIKNVVSGKCVDVKGIPGKNNGDILQLWDCELSGKDPYNNAPTDQKWIFTKDGFIKNVVSGKCVDVKGIPGKNNGDILQLWDCELSGRDPYNNAPTDQRWRFEKTK